MNDTAVKGQMAELARGTQDLLLPADLERKLAHVQVLTSRGHKLFQTEQYLEAQVIWGEALRLLPGNPQLQLLIDRDVTAAHVGPFTAVSVNAAVETLDTPLVSGKVLCGIR